MEKIYHYLNEGVLRQIPSNKIILDVGCGSGILASALRKKGNVVYGLDNSRESITFAKENLDKAIFLDVEKDSIPFPKEYFDVIVFSDILEHLRDPKKIMLKFKPYLKSNGRFIISLPNIASWDIRLKLLLGDFTYTKTGILDETHLRFYTLRTAKKLIRSAGFRITKIDVTPNFSRAFIEPIRAFFQLKSGNKPIEIHKLNKEIFASPFYKIYVYFAQPIETIIARIWKSLFACQFIFVAKKR